MVSNGNLTGLVERLVASGHVARRASEIDRRAQIISLTKSGRAEFRAMAGAHETWVADMFAGLNRDGVERLMELLARTKSSVREASRDA
jgi:DNA-binding MarR family transcriptional regulator